MVGFVHVLKHEFFVLTFFSFFSVDVESQYPVLSKLETVHIEHSQEANKVSDKMNKLTDDYNSLVKMTREKKKRTIYHLARNHTRTKVEVLICLATHANFFFFVRSTRCLRSSCPGMPCCQLQS